MEVSFWQKGQDKFFNSIKHIRSKEDKVKRINIWMDINFSEL